MVGLLVAWLVFPRVSSPLFSLVIRLLHPGGLLLLKAAIAIRRGRVEDAERLAERPVKPADSLPAKWVQYADGRCVPETL